jgi:hypothetical protein
MADDVTVNQSVTSVSVSGSESVTVSPVESTTVVSISGSTVDEVTVTEESITVSVSGGADSVSVSEDSVTVVDVAPVTVGPGGILGDYVSSVAGLTGAVSVSGDDSISVSTSGQTIYLAFTGSGGGSDESLRSEVASISADHEGRLLLLEAIDHDAYATTSAVSAASGSLQLQVDANDTELAAHGVRLDGLEAFDGATVSLVASTSAGLQLQVDANDTELADHEGRIGVLEAFDGASRSLVADTSASTLQASQDYTDAAVAGAGGATTVLGTSGIQVVEGPADTWTVSVSADYATASEVDAASANALLHALAADFSGDYGDLTNQPSLAVYHLEADAASISGGLDSRITAVEADYSTSAETDAASANALAQALAADPDVSSFITSAEVASVSAGLDSRLDVIEADYSTSAETNAASANALTHANIYTDAQLAVIEQESTVIIGENGISVVEAPGQTWTVSVSADYVTISEVNAASANALTHSQAYTDSELSEFGTLAYQDADAVSVGTLGVSGTTIISGTAPRFSIQDTQGNNPTLAATLEMLESFSAGNTVDWDSGDAFGFRFRLSGDENTLNLDSVEFGNATLGLWVVDRATGSSSFSEINSTPIGATTPSSGYFSNLQVGGTDVSLEGHTHDQYTLVVDTASVSAGLDARITAIENDYSTSAETNAASANALMQANAYTNEQGFVDTDGSAASTELAVFSDANTIDGDSKLTWNGIDLELRATDNLTRNLKIGHGRTTSNGFSNISLVGDTSYSTYGLLLSRTAGANGDSRIWHRGTGTLDISLIEAGDVQFNINSTDVLNINASGISLAAGARITEFSIDGSLSGNSDTAVPTEKAVKTYTDAASANALMQANAYTDSQSSGMDLSGLSDDTIPAYSTATSAFVDSNISDDGTAIILGSTTRPGANGVYDLGTTGNRWKDINLSGDLYFGSDFVNVGSGSLQFNDEALATLAETNAASASALVQANAYTDAQVAGISGGGGGGMTLLATYSPSSDTYIDITDVMSSDYRSYRIMGWVNPGTNGDTLCMRMSSDNGLTFPSTSSDYQRSWLYHGGGSITTGQSNNSQLLVTGSGASSSSSRPIVVDITISAANDASRTCGMIANTFYVTSTNIPTTSICTGRRNAIEAVDAIRLHFFTGDFADGEISFYGIE